MYNQTIRSDDENALELLKEKAENLSKEQERMKAANKYFKQNNSMQGFSDTTDEKAAKWVKSIWESREKTPYASWQLSNNYQNLRTTEKRIKSLEHESVYEAEEGKYDTEKYGFTVSEDKDDMRLRLHFSGKPKEEIRNKLKSCGFKWSPTNEAWQRLLNNNARSSLRWFIDFMERQQKSGMAM